MTNTKHTPGPWFFHRDELLHERHPHGSYDLIADVDQDGNGLDWKTNEANACLIAAAPDLLEALEFFYRTCEHRKGWKGFYFIDSVELLAAWNKASAAIAKAKGESL